ncbi:unnamed protein product [Cyclocybe aegerita]|uniref:Uncharacterized protein n=1 Tax=Cyclocybe aegerita TaxID=1973307 RepID=A0A8S0WE44_CYCAE|nr:unnamed protein product [Cyclocybe aegerita]
MKKAREYCCCAIPLVNAGIYATLIEQTSLGILVGTLSVATPSIVGASTPSFAPWILGVIAYGAAGVQILGFLGVSREKPDLYRRYVTIHGLVTSLGFSIALAWIIMSATRHSNAKAKCLADFFVTADGSTASEGDTLCTIFPWVDVGIMGGLWVLLAIVQGYLYFVLSSYGANQRRDHDQYDRVYDPSQPLTSENIPLENDPWDSRPSGDYHDQVGRQDSKYKHLRQESSVSATDILSQPSQEPKDGFLNSNYDYDPYPSNQHDGSLAYPSYAYTQPAAPTPTNNYYYSQPTGTHITPPMHAQAHPAEGSFGRKTPRLNET